MAVVRPVHQVPSRRAGFSLVLAVLLGTWASDIGAYAIGRLIGRRRLAPAISPGKSVEGASWTGRAAAEQEIRASFERAKGTPYEHHHVNLH